MREILEKGKGIDDVKLAKRVGRTSKLRDMVMLVIMWCDREGEDMDAMKVLEEFGIRRGMEGKEGKVIDEALQMLGRKYSAKHL
jgi:hypothetical protein